jgi:hypothetical protein
MSWHYLRELAAVSWEGPSLDGAPDVLLRLIPTVDPSYLRDNVTECCHPSPFGTTLKPSTVDHGGDQLTLLAGVSLARTYPPPGVVPDLPGPVADYFLKCSESLERFGLVLSSRKTRQTFALAGLSPLSKNLTSWGMSAGGLYWEHGTLARRIKGTECGSLDIFPTPTASEHKLRSNQGGAAGRVGKVRPSLGLMAHRDLWPTPTAHLVKEGGYPSEGRRNTPSLTFQAGGPSGGPLSPPWVAWVMGWPLEWTGLEPLEMGKFRRWLVLHGKFSQAGF